MTTYMLPKYGPQCKTLYTNSVSLVDHILYDVYEDMKTHMISKKLIDQIDLYLTLYILVVFRDFYRFLFLLAVSSWNYDHVPIFPFG